MSVRARLYYHFRVQSLVSSEVNLFHLQFWHPYCVFGPPVYWIPSKPLGRLHSSCKLSHHSLKGLIPLPREYRSPELGCVMTIINLSRSGRGTTSSPLTPTKMAASRPRFWPLGGPENTKAHWLIGIICKIALEILDIICPYTHDWNAKFFPLTGLFFPPFITLSIST